MCFVCREYLRSRRCTKGLAVRLGFEMEILFIRCIKPLLEGDGRLRWDLSYRDGSVIVSKFELRD